MKCSAFIATSVDGFIARPDGSVDWLETAGQTDVDLGPQADMGMNAYMASIDCIIMGRKCMETIAGFNLTPEQWPYGDTRIIVLSNSITEVPKHLKETVEIYAGTIPALLTQLESEGYTHAYVDGGATIQSFLNLQLISEITITRAPIILGEGIPLFGPSSQSIQFKQAKAVAYTNDFVQVHYHVSYQ